MSIYAIISGIFACLSACAAVYGWIQFYDVTLRLDRAESRVDSLQSQVGNLKHDLRSELRDEVRKLADEQPQQSGNSGLDMESMMPFLMQQMNGAQPNGNQPEPEPEQENQSAGPPIIGSGGVDGDR